MIAKYNGKCRICNGRIKAGEEITYQREKGAAHPECASGNANAIFNGLLSSDSETDPQRLERHAQYLAREIQEGKF